MSKNLPVQDNPHVESDYGSFAGIYNQWIAEDFAEKMMPAISRLLLETLPEGSRVLDLCCGTGQLARALSSRGFRVVGVDTSSSMLEYARNNAPGCRFEQADAREFDVGRDFDAVVSSFNSLSHMVTGHLVRVFRNVRRALKPDAPFIFDLNMEEAYLKRWRGSFSRVTDESVCIVRPMYEPDRRIGTNLITVFQKPNGKNEWTRLDFTIVQKCHTRAEVENALAQASFREIAALDAQSDLGMTGETGRVFFLCR